MVAGELRGAQERGGGGRREAGCHLAGAAQGREVGGGRAVGEVWHGGETERGVDHLLWEGERGGNVRVGMRCGVGGVGAGFDWLQTFIAAEANLR